MTQKYQVKVSMKQAAIVETGIVLKQGDFGMQIEIEVLDFDATGTTPQIVFRKAMGAVESTTITVSGNKYTYTFRGTELDTPGKVFCDLKLKNSTTQRISTASFMFKVVADTMDGLNQQASSYSDTIEQIVAGFDDDLKDLKSDDNIIISALNDNKFTYSPTWHYGYISNGEPHDMPYTNPNRYAIFTVKAGTHIYNKYTKTLYMYTLVNGSYVQTLIYANAGYIVQSDIELRLSLVLENADATTTFDPNLYIEITVQDNYKINAVSEYSYNEVSITEKSLNDESFIFTPKWYYGYIDGSDGSEKESATPTNQNRFTRLDAKKNTKIENGYSKSLYVYKYLNGVFVERITIIAAAGSYTLSADAELKLSFSLESADATAAFDPNTYITISRKDKYDLIETLQDDTSTLSGNLSNLTGVVDALALQVQNISDTSVVVRNPVVTIAASNAPAAIKDAAEFVCTGTDDQETINLAIASMINGGEIHLTAGLFNISDSIIVDKDLTISGEGMAIGGIPAYQPTNGIVYGSDTAIKTGPSSYYKLVQNLYGSTSGRNTCLRATADKPVIVVSAQTKTVICFHDFYINGYGRDRSTKAGIEILSATDISQIFRVGVTDAYVGIYAWGKENDSSGYMDANQLCYCSLQQCGIGLIMRAHWTKLKGNCIADNNGIDSYRIVSGIQSGGMYIDGSSVHMSDNEIVLSDLYPESHCYALNINGHSHKISGNDFYMHQGGCIRLNAYECMVQNNNFNSWGWENETGYKYAIDVRNNFNVIMGNFIGSIGLRDCDFYGVGSTLPLGTQKLLIRDNTFLNIQTDILDTATLGSGYTNDGNNVWSYI